MFGFDGMKVVCVVFGAALVVACGGSDSGGGTTTNTTKSDGGGGGGGGGSDAGGGGMACDGDWTLGQNAVTSGDTSTFGQACNGAAPTNCPDGLFIKSAGGGCTCIMNCSSLQNVNVGDACNKDGSVKCEKIKATNADGNSATACVPVSWNLCTQ